VPSTGRHRREVNELPPVSGIHPAGPVDFNYPCGFDWRGSTMEDRSLFISSCSRRELARRRPSKSAWSLQLTIATLVLVAAVLAFVVARVGA
jgi:hypothetical protein